MAIVNRIIENNTTPTDYNVKYQEILDEIYLGLCKEQKDLPPKLFYNEEGSKLFDQITLLEEYYPTRTEANILFDNIEEMSSFVQDGSLLIEYGSGSSEKTRILLNYFSNLDAYVSIDISGDYLLSTANNLSHLYPKLKMIPIIADYTKTIDFTPIQNFNGNRIAFFPGSTIGNFYPNEAVSFLKNVRGMVGKNGALIVGVDLHKESSILNAAYNDNSGITAKFNLNMLDHINSKFNGNFIINQFSHRAFYNQEFQRIEMHLISDIKQTVDIDGKSFSFEKDETIRSEVSHKYTVEGFEKLANQAGFKVEKVWTDKANLFSVQYLVSKGK